MEIGGFAKAPGYGGRLVTGARHALRCACLACAERRAAVRLATQDRRRWPRPALDWRGVPFPDSVAAGRAGLAGAAGFLAGCPLPRATSMDDAHAWAHLGGRFARRPSVVVVLVAVNPAASLGISLTVTLMRTRNIFEVERRAKLPERRLFIVLQAVNVTIDDVGDPDTTVHRVPIDVDDGDMPRPPSLTDGLARHADVQDLRIIEDREVEAGLFWQSPCALGERDGRQRQHALNQRVRRHHARPRFPSARRSRYTICALRLRSSSLAHSLSAACRSGGNRRKNFTTASAMSTVYCTLLPPCSHYSRLLLYRWQNDTIRSITREDCQ